MATNMLHAPACIDEVVLALPLTAGFSEATWLVVWALAQAR